jgi:hypothetical protein
LVGQSIVPAPAQTKQSARKLVRQHARSHSKEQTVSDRNDRRKTFAKITDVAAAGDRGNRRRNDIRVGVEASRRLKKKPTRKRVTQS